MAEFMMLIADRPTERTGLSQETDGRELPAVGDDGRHKSGRG